MKNRCNKCRLHKCRCKVDINKPVEVKVGGAGNDGLDAYEIAVLEGFIGTREEWIESLKGKDGSKIEERYAKNDDPDTPPAFIPPIEYLRVGTRKCQRTGRGRLHGL